LFKLEPHEVLPYQGPPAPPPSQPHQPTAGGGRLPRAAAMAAAPAASGDCGGGAPGEVPGAARGALFQQWRPDPGAASARNVARGRSFAAEDERGRRRAGSCPEEDVSGQMEVGIRRVRQTQSSSGSDGRGHRAAVEDAVKVLRAAADKGDCKAQVALGTVYACGHGCPKDIFVGLRWFRRAAKDGSRYAQIKLVEACAVGGPQAKRWLQAGAAEGNAHAMTVLGVLCFRGDLPGGWSEAVGWWRKAADLGCAVAQQHLGCALWAGKGVPTDRTEAERLIRLAAGQGRRDAGRILESLNIPNPQAPSATEVLHEAALRGDARAQFDLACAYAEGEDGPDGERALRMAWWLRLTSLGRTACGQREVLPQNLDEAIAWWQQAATVGLPEAQCNLAVAYLRGVGVRADLQHAVALLRAAASGGHLVASIYLTRIGADADSAGGLGRSSSSIFCSLSSAEGGADECAEEAAHRLRHQRRYHRRWHQPCPGPHGVVCVRVRPAKTMLQSVAWVCSRRRGAAANGPRILPCGQVRAPVQRVNGSWLCESSVRVGAPLHPPRARRKEAALFAGKAGGADSAAGEAPQRTV